MRGMVREAWQPMYPCSLFNEEATWHFPARPCPDVVIKGWMDIHAVEVQTSRANTSASTPAC